MPLQFYPGYLRALAAFEERQPRSERIRFAGDYLGGRARRRRSRPGCGRADEMVASYP
ncbi:MAG TPA: hypothetical protein VNM91_06925 [Dehalococcoidia bacterium]|nr:hypothetical protein [Dehalococcoidia bacterium]